MTKTAPSNTFPALPKGEERFKAIVRHSSDAIQLVGKSGRVLYSSDSVSSISGYSPEELRAKDVQRYLHPEDRETVVGTFAGLMDQHGGRIRIEFRIQHKDGHWVWIEAVANNHLQNPSIRALVINFRDISRRKEVEQALAESEAKLRFMAEVMPQKIFTINNRGRLQYFNAQWNEYTGLPSSDIAQGTFMQFVHPDDAKRSREAWRRALASGEPFVAEYRFKRADGSYRWHLTRATPMLNEQGKITAWIGSSTDIEDVKQSERRQQRLEQRTALLMEQHHQLVELNRAKDEFISLASHQLRTPATGVKQFLGMILEGFVGTEVPPDILKMIEVAYESNERQLKIVNDLLKVAYVDAGRVKLEKEDFSPDTMVREVLRELKPVFEGRQQKVKYTNEARGVRLQADRRLLLMVLENIIDNASKYSPEGGSITVTVSHRAGFLCFNITDQGVGISALDQARLFKKFSRIDNPLSTKVGGTGLGLYWAQQIVALHRGSIMVRSKPGNGSTFSIQIPLRKSRD